MNAKQHAESRQVPVGVVGARGYTGSEVLGLLARHPGVEVSFATSRSQAGESTFISGLTFSEPDPEACRQVEVVFLCVPHGEGANWVELIGEGPRIIDLTADHRPGSGRESGAVYGLAELAGDAVASANLVANPGCYPTGANLALRPLQDAGLVDTQRLTVINAASGVTGAGRSPRTDLLFAEVAGNYRAYGEGNRHRHLKEIRAELPQLSLLFQPHLLPVSRGILETITVPVVEGVDVEQVRETWRGRYGHGGAVQVLERGLPSLQAVVNTDLLLLGATEVDGVEPPVVTVVAALDNLGKGAAGQAVQNMNTMLGWTLNKGIRCER
jgi:N-acetyl-gamma-glutamyl-phosphate reductase